MWDQIREDWAAHGRDWTRPGFRAVAVLRFGRLQLTAHPRLRPWLGRAHTFLHRWIRNRYGIELPHTLQLGRRTVVEHQGAIVVHGCAVIGDDCLIRQGVTIGNRHLDRPYDAPRLGDRVEVGAGAKLLGAIEVGDDARIGANAVLLTDLPAGCTAVGVPAVVASPL